MTMTAAELVASKKHILLDFDGPICAAFAGYGASKIAQRLATLVSQKALTVPPTLFGSADPFEVLRFAASTGDPKILEYVNNEFKKLELQAVVLAPPTTGAANAIRALSTRGHTVSIVSNNSREAVLAYARRNGIEYHLEAVSARVSPDPSLLKPSPHLIHGALRELQAAPRQAIMVGDSVSDIQAARQAQVAAMAFVNKASKADVLRSAWPDATITSIAELLG